jgi:hypothetical protein
MTSINYLSHSDYSKNDCFYDLYIGRTLPDCIIVGKYQTLESSIPYQIISLVYPSQFVSILNHTYVSNQVVWYVSSLPIIVRCVCLTQIQAEIDLT